MSDHEGIILPQSADDVPEEPEGSTVEKKQARCGFVVGVTTDSMVFMQTSPPWVEKGERDSGVSDMVTIADICLNYEVLRDVGEVDLNKVLTALGVVLLPDGNVSTHAPAHLVQFDFERVATPDDQLFTLVQLSRAAFSEEITLRTIDRQMKVSAQLNEMQKTQQVADRLRAKGGHLGKGGAPRV